MTRNVACFAALVATLTAGIASTAGATGVGKQRAAALAKRVASARADQLGISYPPSDWKADCAHRSAGGWRCAVGTGGQCSGLVTITGTSVRPRVRSAGRFVLRLTRRALQARRGVGIR
jgi:hypothetical protein